MLTLLGPGGAAAIGAAASNNIHALSGSGMSLHGWPAWILIVFLAVMAGLILEHAVSELRKDK